MRPKAYILQISVEAVSENSAGEDIFHQVGDWQASIECRDRQSVLYELDSMEIDSELIVEVREMLKDYEESLGEDK